MKLLQIVNTSIIRLLLCRALKPGTLLTIGSHPQRTGLYPVTVPPPLHQFACEDSRSIVLKLLQPKACSLIRSIVNKTDTRQLQQNS
ncbi:hypothetical protein J6590_004028 [Homalodisca vitripennis]|nr:hypothetical protein J6590_004028 [Homalodisca vitripennis]